MSEKWKGFVSGGVGGVCLVMTGHPFDTIKVRLQVDHAGHKYKGMMHCARLLLANEGIRGFYKGMATPVVGITPIFSTYFLGYHLAQDCLRSWRQSSILFYKDHFIAGMFAGLLSSAITAPGERIKCLLQTQNKSSRYTGPIHCLTTVYQQQGIRGVFKGTYATLLRDIPSSGVYFSSYEFLKNYFSSNEGNMDVRRTLLAGGLAGVCNWLVALPADVIKSRLQTDNAGVGRVSLRGVLGDLLKEEGLRGLYKGAYPVLLRAFPANAACFVGYESTLKFLNFLFP